MKAVIMTKSGGIYSLERKKKFTILYNGVYVIEQWLNEDIDKLYGDFDAQVKHFEKTL